MSPVETAASVIGGVAFVVWVASMYAWIRRGCRMPTWLHVFALVAFVVGAGLGACLVLLGGRSVWVALACGLGFPAGVYVSWLWMFGPDWAAETKKRQASS